MGAAVRPDRGRLGVRIIAGQWKGRRLATPTWPGLRPTSDKLRETLFNIVAPRIADAHVSVPVVEMASIGVVQVVMVYVRPPQFVPTPWNVPP